MGKRILSVILLLTAAMALFLSAWAWDCEPLAHSEPGYEKKDIRGALQLLEEDGLLPEGRRPEDGEHVFGKNSALAARAAAEHFIFLQTGLSSWTVNELCSQGRAADILRAQEAYFRRIRVRCEPNTVLTREERLEDGESGMPVWAVEDGDILITFCSHFSGWRNGHAAIVADAEKRLTLEARVLGSPSRIMPLDHWEEYPSYAVLRLRGVDAGTRRQAAAYAAEYLAGVPYRLTAGLLRPAGQQAADAFPEASDSIPTGTQCAHLVWCAYRHFGYDLDSDGGRLVTPADLFESPLLETVQIYGMTREER